MLFGFIQEHAKLIHNCLLFQELVKCYARQLDLELSSLLSPRQWVRLSVIANKQVLKQHWHWAFSVSGPMLQIHCSSLQNELYGCGGLKRKCGLCTHGDLLTSGNRFLQPQWVINSIFEDKILGLILGTVFSWFGAIQTESYYSCSSSNIICS